MTKFHFHEAKPITNEEESEEERASFLPVWNLSLLTPDSETEELFCTCKMSFVDLPIVYMCTL